MAECPDCTQANEQVRISFCSEADVADEVCTRANTIEFLDEVVGDDATTRTDTVIQNLQFSYLLADGVTQTTSNLSVVFVRVEMTIRTRTINAATGNPETRLLQSTVRVRDR